MFIMVFFFFDGSSNLWVIGSILWMGKGMKGFEYMLKANHTTQ